MSSNRLALIVAWLVSSAIAPPLEVEATLPRKLVLRTSSVDCERYSPPPAPEAALLATDTCAPLRLAFESSAAPP